MYTIQPPLLALKDFLESDTNDRLVVVLSTLDLEPLLRLLDRRRGRGRRGYSVRSMLYAVIAGWVYDLHSMAELRRNGSLRILCGIQSVAEIPSEDALSRFFGRLAGLKEEVAKLHTATVAQILELAPEVGEHVAVDSTDIRAWSRRAADAIRGRARNGKPRWSFPRGRHLRSASGCEFGCGRPATPIQLPEVGE